MQVENNTLTHLEPRLALLPSLRAVYPPPSCNHCLCLVASVV